MMELQKNLNEILPILNAILESAIIIYTDLEGTIIESNNLFCKVSGYDRSELINKRMSMLNSGYHDKHFYKDLWDTIKSGKVWTGEIRNRAKDGSFYWVHTVIAPIKDSNGKITKYMSIRYDITRQRNAQLALLSNEERWRMALDTYGRGMWDWNIPNQTLHLSGQYFNVFKKENLKSFDCLLNTVHPDDRQYVAECIHSALENIRDFSIDHRVIWPDGAVGWVHNKGDVISSPDQTPMRVVGLIEDITQKKQKEEMNLKLITSAKLSALGEMACGIVHEINNPLAIIFGRITMIRMIMEETKEIDRQLLSETLDKIESAVKHMASITKGLSLYSRNAEDDSMEEILISEALSNTLDICHDNFRFNSTELKVDIKAIEGILVIGRPGQLSQVFLNLLSNALDAVQGMPIKWVKLKGEVEHGNILIRIVDSGPGVPGEIENKIMDSFFTTKGPGKGTGLGLSISKGIIEDHRGNIFHDKSFPNTCFVVEIPILRKGK